MTTEPRLPQVSSNLHTEREGVTAVALAMARIGQIWRETPTADMGIDGQIEHVTDAGGATGQLVAVQIKSGESHFHDGRDEWRFYPEQKHRFYWERYPLPVILVLHSPAQKLSYWVDVRLALRSVERSRLPYIAVPKRNVLQEASPEQLFASIAMTSRPFLSIEQVFRHVLKTDSQSGSFPVSYLELFVVGLINLNRSIYCSMDLAFRVAEETLAESNPEVGAGIGPQEQEFVFGFILFLAEQHLAEVDVSQCLIDWYDHELQPTLIGALTSRGRALAQLITSTESRLSTAGKLHVPQYLSVVQEGSVMMHFPKSFPARADLIRAFRVAATALDGSAL